MVSKPQVITKKIDGKINEPVEHVFIDVPEEYVGAVTEKLSTRKGRMTNLANHGHGRVNIEFIIPSRGLIGFRSHFLTDTKGAGIMNSIFHGYEPYMGSIQGRRLGSLVAWEAGISTTYALNNAQEHGLMFIGPGVEVYEGMVVGENVRPDDIAINVAKTKHVTNHRRSFAEDAIHLTPPRLMSLDDCIEFLTEDELLGVTSNSLRIRKRILSNDMRMKEQKRREKIVAG